MSDSPLKSPKKSLAEKIASRRKNDGIPMSIEHDTRYDFEASNEFAENRRIQGEARALDENAEETDR